MEVLDCRHVVKLLDRRLEGPEGGEQLPDAGKLPPEKMRPEVDAELLKMINVFYVNPLQNL